MDLDNSFEELFDSVSDLTHTESSANTGSTHSNSQDCVSTAPLDLSYAFNELHTTASKKKAGRRDTPGTILLKGIMNKGGRQLKKEYKRCQMIRAMKKMIRQFEKKEFTRKFNEMFDFTEERDVRLVKKMKELYFDNESLFKSISPTISGPLTDGKVFRRRSSQSASPSESALSFNNHFCKDFFTPLSVREFLSLMVELVYGPEDDTNPERLCANLNEFCCMEKKHTVKCVQAWKQVRKYMAEVMVEELGLIPFNKNEERMEWMAEPDYFLSDEIMFSE